MAQKSVSRFPQPPSSLHLSRIAVAVGLAWSAPQVAHALPSCLTYTSTVALSGSTSCVDWQGGNLSITNTGLIDAGTTNVYALSASSASPLSILINEGTIRGGSGYTFVVSANTSVASVSNSGTITGTLPVRIVGSVTTLGNTGTIASTGDTGLEVDGSFTQAYLGTLTNSGTISGNALAGLRNLSGTIGTIQNNSAGTILASGTVGTISSGLLNAGSITSLSNNGTISGTDVGVRNLSALNTIVNQGLIAGSGTVSGSIYGIQDSGGTIGTIQNSGTILGSTNSGTIVGYAVVVDASGKLGTLSNDGLMSGEIGLLARSQGSIGTVTNTGRLLSTFSGVVAQGGTIQSIENSGTISSGLTAVPGYPGPYTGIYALSGASIGTVTNSGTIVGMANAINVDSSSTITQIANSGLIAGNITNNSTRSLSLSGGAGQTWGALTGTSGGLGAADKGTIVSPNADLLFTAGNLIVNDDINVGATHSVVNSGATLGLVNAISVTGGYTQTGGGLLIGASSPSSYGYLNVSGNASISNASITLFGTGMAAGQTFTIVRPGGTGDYHDNTAFLSTNNGLLAQLSSVSDSLVLTLAEDAEHHYWDGGNTSATGAIAGGSGTWTANGTNWTSTDGSSNGTLSSANVRPVFAGAAGTVTVDNSQGAINVAGMQFSTDGYRLAGGTIGLSAAASAFEVDDNVNATIDSVLSGTGGLSKTGNGMLILNGVNTYTGGTTVDAGTLEIGDADHATASILGDVAVNTGGTLRGHGTIGGSVTNSGTVRPGGSIGTLTIAGNYTQTSSGTLYIDVSPTAASQLNVGGTATLAGTLNVLYGPGTYGAASYRILNAASTTGSFSSVVSNAPASIAQSVQNLADGSTLTLSPVTGATDGAGGGDVVVIKPTNATIFGALGSAAIREGQRVNDVLLSRLAGKPGAGSGVATGDAQGIAGASGSQAWTQLVSTTNHVRGDDQAPSYKDSHYGFLAGLDHQVGDWTLGVAGGYSHIDVREDAASGKIDTVRLAGYGARYVGPVNIAATVGAAYDFLNSNRGFGQLGNAKGNTDGQEFTAGLQASLPLATGPLIVTPRAGLRYQYFHAGSFGETGPTSQNLDVGTQNLHSLQPYAQLSVGLPFNSGAAQPALVEARVGYAYETLDRARGVDAAAGDGTRFGLPGATSPRGMLSAGIGLTMPVGKSMDVTASYDRLFKTGNTWAQAFQLQATYRF